jgi:hypothetical protein
MRLACTGSLKIARSAISSLPARAEKKAFDTASTRTVLLLHLVVEFRNFTHS